jgi:chromosome segregation ATPase
VTITLGRKARKHRGKSGLQLQKELAAAERRVAALTAGIDQISAERNEANKRAEQAAIDLGTARKEIRQLEETVRLRDQQITDLQRKVDIGVKAEHVVTRTQELSVEEIRRHCIKPVPLHEAPFATTDPAHVPAWASRD